MKTNLMRFIAIFSFSIFFFSSVRADEGMWLLSMIDKNYDDMKAQGFKLTAEDIYSINKSSLKDAIPQFAGGCTAEIVSSEGLLFTNHHCGYGSIQALSSVENDYLKNGFWAMSKDKELACKGLSVKFLIEMKDVTDKILSDFEENETSDEQTNKITKNISEVKKAYKNENNYTINIKPLFNGNQYFLFVYQSYNDVRLAGTPPSSIGKFGGDTDNWMWPRHTGDFSMFRIYADKDNKPAEYSKDNVPYRPKQFLKVSISGVKENDFAMIMGFPGSTNRYKSSFGVKQAIETTNPVFVKVRTKKLEILNKYMAKNDTIRVKYAGKHAGISNYWKYFIGQTAQLKQNGVIAKKQKVEADFQEWIRNNPDKKSKYGNVLRKLETSYFDLKDYNRNGIYFFEVFSGGSEAIKMAKSLEPYYNKLKNGELTNEDKEALLKIADKHYKNYTLKVEKELFAATLKIYYEDIEQKYQPDIFRTIETKYKKDFNKFTENAFAKSIFSSKKLMQEFIEKASYKVLEKDLIFQTIQSAYKSRSSFVDSKVKAAFQEQKEAKKMFVDGILQIYPDKKFYPDANLTMRLTYGQVLPYKPRDAVFYNYFTTTDGIIEKKDNTNHEFVVHPKLEKLIREKDFGQYAENGKLVTCFLTNNDITGGNSGSPVLNCNGELIGLAFDGNWEAMSGDIFFEDDLQRCIVADIRYVLWVIDKFAGATNLIDEMSIVR